MKKYQFKLVLAVSAALVAATPAFAATWTWNGSQGNDHWTNTGKLDPGQRGGERRHGGRHFRRSTRLTPDMNANWNVHSVTFNDTAGGFTLFSSTGSTLTVGAGGITDNAVRTSTITHAITLSAAQTWTAVVGPICVTGAVNNGGNLLTINAASASARRSSAARSVAAAG